MNTIFECTVGSHAYGTNIATSDVDIKGVYTDSLEQHLGFKKPNQKNVDKDTVYYEIERFLELAKTANPTILEMLFVDYKFVSHCSKSFKIFLENRNMFLTKQCANSFLGYAHAQIMKAKGTDKKMNWEKDRIERKTIMDFCYVVRGRNTYPAEDVFIPETVCASKIDHAPGMYAIYKDDTSNCKGLIGDETTTTLRTHNIDRNAVFLDNMYFNQDAWQIHCKEYNQYQEWLDNRNTDRYVDVKNHEQKIDGKNMMHCMRLLRCAKEIAETGELNVFRPDADYLLQIRRGEFNLDRIIEECTQLKQETRELFDKSSLPDKVDDFVVEQMLIDFRKQFYNIKH